MNAQDRAIMDAYRLQRNDYCRLGDAVNEKLHSMTHDLHVETMAIEHRVKQEDSLAGKLYRKSGKYHKLEDLTDILGCRVICFFTDDVDRMCAAVEKEFLVDWANSDDKRSLLSVNAFGYLSVHYICSLRPDQGYDESLLGKRFEIQLRTGLQHIWAAINHDIGYKSRFGVPTEITREFSRLAGLLELADEEFVRVRSTMQQYVADIHEKIIHNQADTVKVDAISIQEYMQYNERMAEFLGRLSAIEHSEILNADSAGYVPALAGLNVVTLGDLAQMLDENQELAYQLAYRVLNGSEMDILTSNTALRFLCQACLLNRHASLEEMESCFALLGTEKNRVHAQAERLMKIGEEMRL